jgi:hypothetical protein
MKILGELGEEAMLEMGRNRVVALHTEGKRGQRMADSGRPD